MPSKTGPVSAIAARRLKQKLASATSAASASESPADQGPPLKKTKASPARASSAVKNQSLPSRRGEDVKPKRDSARSSSRRQSGEEGYVIKAVDKLHGDDVEEGAEDEEVDAVSVVSEERDSDEAEAPSPARFENFLLGKTRLSKSNVAYSTDSAICVHLKMKMTLAIVGQYDLWVKRGVVSIMGAKLHPSPQLYRVYAPSTHSLPVIKCVAGIDDYAEIEIRSCQTGPRGLKSLSNLYQRIWNSKKASPAGVWQPESPMSFSILHSSSDDPLKRNLRPFHLDKKWSISIKALSQRGSALRVLTCGPKGSGKSTFNKYLLNHLLSPPPTQDGLNPFQDGVAYIDLDPGQPEFGPMGQVYLVHLKSPVLGPSFTHPIINNSKHASMIRAHHIGDNSPKVDPDHYIMAAMDLMHHYRILLQSYPQCPLIINYPGWIFGLGLEMATLLIKSLGLSDVVYMSEKGPMEVVEPLGMAAQEVGLPMTILPSQPLEFVARSSAQLRSMQTQSYFHSFPYQANGALWSDVPLCRTQPITVSYSGSSQGLFGIMVTGSHQDPAFLRDLLEGAVVGVVAIENLDAIAKPIDSMVEPNNDIANGSNTDNPDSSEDISMLDATNPDEQQHSPPPSPPPPQSPSNTPHPIITRTTHEKLPYLYVGNGTCTPLDPNKSHSLGLALIHSINPTTQTLDLYTPIPPSTIRATLEHGHKLVLVRGQLDNPNWAISEEYFAARAAQRRHRRVMQRAKAENESAGRKMDATTRAEYAGVAERLKERVHRARNVPWMKMVEDEGVDMKEVGVRDMWTLRKRAYPADSGSGSEGEY
ncbi:hypothetical protein AJ80_04422 [Polytolypa hystricis UAMH7299]|uniref:Polynucleotide 5'-hydroxyl-kinase GRC3 n=1 Tax=Polytolypa hystricis (strain UAMH7299) TaxID=1447883 RepID=A0A2B7Y3J3_POLH7|nr:hypothetical protein AJ80_04422 [Polytolypa hystricis UAMH7299]